MKRRLSISGGRRGLVPVVGLAFALAACVIPGRATSAQPPARPVRPDTVRTDSTRRDTVATDSLRVPTNRAAAAQPRPPRRGRPGAAAAPAIRPPITPRRALLYSMALPGYAQTRLDRSATGAFFFFVEAGALAMVAKSSFDLEAARAFRGDSLLPTSYPVDTATGLPATTTAPGTDRNNFADALVRARRLHLEDWIAVLAFNHLIAGAEAYVSANLWDLPTQISARPLTHGGVALAMSVAW